MQYPFTMWRWRVTDEVTKRRRTTSYHMTEEEARKRFGADAEKVFGTDKVIEHAASGQHYPLPNQGNEKMPIEASRFSSVHLQKDKRFAVINLTLQDGRAEAIRFDPKHITELVVLLAQAQTGYDENRKLMLPVSEWMLGKSDDGEDVLIFRSAPGLELSFKIGSKDAKRFHEALGIHLGVTKPAGGEPRH